MQCKRCTTNGEPTRMHHVVTTLGASTLERYAETDIYSGYTCYCCGTWIGDEPIIKIQEVPPVPAQFVRPQVPKLGNVYRSRIGQKYKKEIAKRKARIKKLREGGMGWRDMAALFAKEGFKVSMTCLRNHWLEMEQQAKAA